MPKGQLPLLWRQAALRLEAVLREKTGQAPERLAPATIAVDYPSRDWIVGAWRIAVVFSDGVARRIDLVAGPGFPSTPVRTALVDHPEPMTWPHVESDGILCLLPNLAEWDPDDPCEVALNLLGRSVRLVEELLEGDIVERDFREEFVTYWAYQAHGRGDKIISLVEPRAPSREVCVWRGHGIEVFGEDVDALASWVHRRFGSSKAEKTEAAAFLWLEEPLLPAQYPQTAADLHALAAEIGNDALQVLENAASGEPDEIMALLCAQGRGGAAVIGVKTLNPKRRKRRPGGPDDPVSKGYRAGHAPTPLVIGRLFGPDPVYRTLVNRADAAWIHGRGKDSRTQRLLDATVVLIGCGSVGGPVACSLVQAGVGRIVLVDPDALSWPNLGRHPLGASSVGLNKAKELAERLQRDHPHLLVECFPCRLENLLSHHQDLLADADLIVSATGNWVAESALNRWHLEGGRTKPVLYAWTEAHACAGHAVVIGQTGGCCACHIGRTGTPDSVVVEWPNDGDSLHEEPACGAHYQPYGPIELAYVTAMVGEVALDCLLEPPRESFERVFVAAEKRIASLGGQLADGWRSTAGVSHGGIRTSDRPWTAANHCACGCQ